MEAEIGDADDVVRPRNSQNLAAAIERAGGAATLRVYPGMGHTGIVMALAGVFSNMVMIGITLVELAYGKAGLVTLLTLVSVHALILLSAGSVVLELTVAREVREDGGPSPHLWASLGSVIKGTLIRVLKELSGAAERNGIPGAAVLFRQASRIRVSAAPPGLADADPRPTFDEYIEEHPYADDFSMEELRASYLEAHPPKHPCSQNLASRAFRLD